jgi:hypothetical protein
LATCFFLSFNSFPTFFIIKINGSIKYLIVASFLLFNDFKNLLNLPSYPYYNVSHYLQVSTCLER